MNDIEWLANWVTGYTCGIRAGDDACLLCKSYDYKNKRCNFGENEAESILKGLKERGFQERWKVFKEIFECVEPETWADIEAKMFKGEDSERLFPKQGGD